MFLLEYFGKILSSLFLSLYTYLYTLYEDKHVFI